MSQTASPPADWIGRHLDAWRTKPGLRAYYGNEIFARIERRSRPGAMLELGGGPGFFAARHPHAISIDLTPGPRTDIVADAHGLPFRAGSFETVVGIDMLHHMRRPADMIGEALRVLNPGGRLILVEPWAGPLGRLFYRHVHHEGCEALDDPLGTAFAGDKAPMDGNAMIPRALFVDHAQALEKRFPALRILEVVPFGCFSYLLTGGFQAWAAPAVVTGSLARLERLLPAPIQGWIAMRVLLVAERATQPS